MSKEGTLELPNSEEIRMALSLPVRSILVAAVALSATGCIVNPPAETQAAAAPKSTVAAKGEGELICQNYNATASRVRREKVCMTAEQWKALNEDAEGYTRAMQSNGSAQAGGQTLTGP